MDKKLVHVGEVVRPQGIKGKLKVRPLADLDVFSSAKGVYLTMGEGLPSYYKALSCQIHKGSAILALDGIETMSQAEDMVGSQVFADIASLEKLPEGEYYGFQIIGLDVMQEDGRPLGKVTDIIATGGNDVYVVKDKTQEYLIPAIEQVVKVIDVSGGRMVISPMKGLLGEE